MVAPKSWRRATHPEQIITSNSVGSKGASHLKKTRPERRIQDQKQCVILTDMTSGIHSSKRIEFLLMIDKLIVYNDHRRCCVEKLLHLPNLPLIIINTERNTPAIWGAVRTTTRGHAAPDEQLIKYILIPIISTADYSRAVRPKVLHRFTTTVSDHSAVGPPWSVFKSLNPKHL